MDENILQDDDLGGEIPLDELHVTDLPRAPGRLSDIAPSLSARWRAIMLMTLALVVVLAADIQLGSLLLPRLDIVPTPIDIPLPTLAAQPAAAITGASPWQQVALPVAADLIESFGAASDNPDHAFLCAGASYNASDETIAGTATLWATADGGAHWHVVHPAMNGSVVGCRLNFDSANAQHIALYEEDRANSTQAPCAGTIALSADGGHSWQARPIAPIHTASAYQTVYCELTATPQHLYIGADFTNDDLMPHQYREYTMLLRSDDDGITWHDITPTPSDGVSITSWPLLISGDTLIEGVNIRLADTIQQILWKSRDAGKHWQRITPNTALVFNMLASIPGDGTALYGIDGFTPPSRFFDLHVLYSTDGGSWAFLPPLPVAHASAAHPGFFGQLGVTTQGNLIIVGVNPDAQLPYNNAGGFLKQSVPLTLWEWDHTQQRWRHLTQPLPFVEPTSCGGCFQFSLSHGVATDGKTLGTTVVIRVEYPSSTVWRIFLPDLP